MHRRRPFHLPEVDTSTDKFDPDYMLPVSGAELVTLYRSIRRRFEHDVGVSPNAFLLSWQRYAQLCDFYVREARQMPWFDIEMNTEEYDGVVLGCRVYVLDHLARDTIYAARVARQ